MVASAKGAATHNRVLAKMLVEDHQLTSVAFAMFFASRQEIVVLMYAPIAAFVTPVSQIVRVNNAETMAAAESVGHVRTEKTAPMACALECPKLEHVKTPVGVFLRTTLAIATICV